MTENIKLRIANKDDAPAIARAHVAGWQAAYKNIVDQDYLDNLSVEEKTAEWQRWFDEDNMRVVVSESEEGVICGFSGFGKLRTPVPGMSPIRPLYTGEIYALYLLPEYHRRGIGTRLLKETARQLKDMRHKSMCLWVAKKNKQAVSFYKEMGGQRCGKIEIEVGPSSFIDAAFGWRDTSPLIQD